MMKFKSLVTFAKVISEPDGNKFLNNPDILSLIRQSFLGKKQITALKKSLLTESNLGTPDAALNIEKLLLAEGEISIPSTFFKFGNYHKDDNPLQHAITSNHDNVSVILKLLGFTEVTVPLPVIPAGSKVLDVGAGSGYIAQRIRDNFNCDVYALEPDPLDFNSCLDKMDKDRVENLTLQEAMAQYQEKYFQAFDVVCVFKYNILCDDKKAFIQCLANAVKPDGLVYITSVEPDRFTYIEASGEGPYLMETLKEYFNDISFITRETFNGSDQLMTLKGPKLIASNQFSYFSP